MKKAVTKFRDGMVFGVGVLFVFGIANAWVDLGTVSNGETLTSTIWNELIGKVNENGNKLIGVTNTGTGHVFNGVVESTNGGIKFPDGTTQITATIGTTDTNAGTECNIGEYLDGDGTCKTERYNSAYDTETEIDAAVANNGYMTSGDTTPDTIADDGVISSSEILDNTITESDISDSFKARDSDKLDAIDSSQFLRSDTSDTTVGNLTINNVSPTTYYVDTNSRSAMVHVNSNLFYVLRGCGTNSSTWCQYNSRWPLYLNLENNDAVFGGNINALGANMNNNKITNVANPTSAQDAATKAYVDSVVSGASATMNLYSGNGCGACPYGSYTTGGNKYCYRKSSGGTLLSHGAYGTSDRCQLSTLANSYAFRSY